MLARPYWGHLYLNSQSFPDEMDFKEKSIGSIMLRRIVHFFTPETMEQSLDKVEKWLAPGGSVYIIILSPYHYSVKDDFLPIYESRWKDGNPWPGVIEDMHKYRPDLATKIPKFLHVMDERPLRKALEKRGFTIEKASLFGFDRSLAMDPAGEGYFGIKAVKN